MLFAWQNLGGKYTTFQVLLNFKRLPGWKPFKEQFFYGKFLVSCLKRTDYLTHISPEYQNFKTFSNYGVVIVEDEIFTSAASGEDLKREAILIKLALHFANEDINVREKLSLQKLYRVFVEKFGSHKKSFFHFYF